MACSKKEEQNEMKLAKFEKHELALIAILPPNDGGIHHACDAGTAWPEALVRAAALDTDGFYAAGYSSGVSGWTRISVLIRVADFAHWQDVVKAFKCPMAREYKDIRAGSYGNHLRSVEILETKNGDLIWYECK